MLIVTVSGYAWTHHRAAAWHLVQRAIAARPQAAIAIDRDTVLREQSIGAQSPDSGIDAHQVAFACWLKAGHVEDGVLDVHAIRAWPQGAAPNLPVLLDARAHRADLIAKALPHLRYAWFPLDEWHPAFVLVCDDPYLLSLADQLADTFFCQGQLMTEREIAKIVRGLMRRASAYRWLGPGVRGWQKLAFRVIDFVAERIDRAAERRETRV